MEIVNGNKRQGFGIGNPNSSLRVVAMTERTDATRREGLRHETCATSMSGKARKTYYRDRVWYMVPSNVRACRVPL